MATWATDFITFQLLPFIHPLIHANGVHCPVYSYLYAESDSKIESIF